MRVTLVSATIAAVLVGGAGADAPAAAKQARVLAFTAAEREGRLVVVDVARRRIVRRLAVGSGPHNVAASRDGRFVLVTSPPAGRVTLVGGRSARRLAEFGGLAYPHDVKVHPAGRFAYVTERDTGAVVVLDLDRRRVAARVNVGAQPHDVAIGPAGRRAWVTFDPGESRMAVLDLSRPARPSVVARVAGRIGTPHDLAFAGSGRVWVTYWASGTVGLVAARSGLLLRRVAVGAEPHHLAADAAASRLWITDNVGGRAVLLDPRSGRVLRRASVGPQPHHVALRSGLAVVASHAGGFLSVHTVAGRPVARVQAGRGLHGVALTGGSN
jgi:YVTN family beta-propeller protein